MKKYTLITTLSAVLSSLGMTTQAATIYCVHDDGLNDSQFCIGTPFPFSSGIFPMGPLYQNCDIEALDLDEDGEYLFLNLYAASGDDTPRPGHLYMVDKFGAPLWDWGDIWVVDPAGKPVKNITEVDAISFNPRTHTLWGWGQHTGLFFIDSLPPPSSISPENEIDPQVGCVANEPQVGIIGATVVFPTQEIEMEDLTWNRTATVLYGAENIHNDSEDFDVGTDKNSRLWAYDTRSGFVGHICPSLVTSEIEGLEALPPVFNKPWPISMDLLLIGFHGSKKVTYMGVLVSFGNTVTPPTCDIIWAGDIPVAEGINDIEGLAYDLFDPSINP